MPAMESTGGAFSPRSSRTQTPMMPQAKFNMPARGGGNLRNLQPVGGGLKAGLGAGNSAPPGGAAGGGMMPSPGVMKSTGGGLTQPRPPRTMQPGMGMR